MKNNVMLVAALVVCLAIQAAYAQASERQPVQPGEQAPRATRGQRNFGGFQPPAGGAGATRRGGQMPNMMRRGNATQQSQTVAFDDISMSDPFIYPDKETKTYYLTGTGGDVFTKVKI